MKPHVTPSVVRRELPALFDCEWCGVETPHEPLISYSLGPSNVWQCRYCGNGKEESLTGHRFVDYGLTHRAVKWRRVTKRLVALGAPIFGVILFLAVLVAPAWAFRVPLIGGWAYFIGIAAGLAIPEVYRRVWRANAPSEREARVPRLEAELVWRSYVVGSLLIIGCCAFLWLARLLSSGAE